MFPLAGSLVGRAMDTVGNGGIYIDALRTLTAWVQNAAKTSMYEVCGSNLEFWDGASNCSILPPPPSQIKMKERKEN